MTDCVYALNNGGYIPSYYNIEFILLIPSQSYKTYFSSYPVFS